MRARAITLLGAIAIIVAAMMVAAAPTPMSAAATIPATTTTAPPGCAQTAPRAGPGIFMVWGTECDVQSMSYVHGGQIMLNWADIETSRGIFPWDNQQDPQKDLRTQLKFYYDHGKPTTIQVDSSQKPSWIYNYGILKCGTRSVGHNPDATPYDVPQYWAANYQPIMQEMLTSLANYLRTSPYKDAVVGVRTSPNLIGTEHWRLDDPLVSRGPNWPICNSQWSPSLGQQVYAQIMQMNYNTFEPFIRPILRADFFTALGAYNGSPATYLAERPKKVRAWFFVTSGDPDSSASNKNSFFYAWARKGTGIAYSESVLNSNASGGTMTPFTKNPVSWNYWRQLMELDRGVSYVATYGVDLLIGQTGAPPGPEYLAAFDATNKYAGYSANPAQSPGAWVAFSPDASLIPGASTDGNTHGNFGWFVTQYNADGTPGGDTATVGRNSLDSSGHNPGSAMIGPADQRYGRYARSTEVATGKNTFFLRLDGTFKTSLTRPVTINVTYLDQGSGSFVVKWGTGGSQQQTVTKQNSGRWVTVGINGIPAASFTGRLPVSSDITLSATTEDTTFHLVEVTR